MDRILLDKISVSNLQDYTQSNRSTTISGSAFILPPRSFVVLNFNRKDVDECQITFRRDSGNGLMVTHCDGRNVEHRVSSKSGEELNFRLKSEKKIHIHRTPRGTGNIAITSVLLYGKAMTSVNWNDELKKSDSYECLRLVGDDLFAAEGGFIKGMGIVVETEPASCFSYDAAGVKFHTGCKIIALRIAGGRKRFPAPLSRMNEHPKPLINDIEEIARKAEIIAARKVTPIPTLVSKKRKDLVIYDTNNSGFIKPDMLYRARFAFGGGLILDHGGKYVVKGLEASIAYTLYVDVAETKAGETLGVMLSSKPEEMQKIKISGPEKFLSQFKPETADSLTIFKPTEGPIKIRRIQLVKHMMEDSPLSMIPKGYQKETPWKSVVPCFVDTETEKQDASILITTYKRPHLLRHGLASLSRQNFDPYKVEVIVLNDWLPDETESICDEFRERGLNIKYVFTGQRNFYEDIPRMPGYALNIGARIAHGRMLFISCAEMYHTDMGAVKGMIDVLKDDETTLVNCAGREDQGELVRRLNDGEEILKTHWLKAPKLVGMQLPYFLGMHRNMFFEIRGYDEDFIGLVADDNDFVDRLVKNGCEYKTTNNVVIHLNHERLLDSTCKLNTQDIHTQKRVNLNRQMYYGRSSYVGRNPDDWGKVTILPRYKEWHLSKIPKVAHFYWGGDTLPYLRYLTLHSFIKYNPDWTVKLHRPKTLGAIAPTWRSNEQKQTTNTHKVSTDYSDEIKRLGIKEIFHIFRSEYGFSDSAHEVHKSDYLRWRLLASEGGVWCDMDILFTRPMVHMIDNTPENANVNSCVCTYKDGCHAIGFLMSSENNPFYKDVAEKSKKAFNQRNYQSIGSVMFGRFYRNEQKIRRISSEIVPLYINLKTVYSITHINDFLSLDNSIDQYPDAIGFHWYGGHPDTSKVEARINKSNYMNEKTFIGKLVLHILGAK